MWGLSAAIGKIRRCAWRVLYSGDAKALGVRCCNSGVGCRDVTRALVTGILGPKVLPESHIDDDVTDVARHS